ncbi:MAG: polymer-forming cytoskeletal protein [Myxococcota bacterium]|nr:polymer-forming cytoskeletal protein [Myxococcota bacterium]
MLKKDTTAPATNVHDVHTILGPESSFEGKLVFDGTVRIDGKFKGEIQTSDVLVIGQSARIQATIKVGQIVVNGEIGGDIEAQSSVELNAPAKVVGNITTPELMIAKGVTFQGSCNMTNLKETKILSSPPKPVTALVAD